MRYLCFANTAHGEFRRVIYAQDDDVAMRRLETWLRDCHNIRGLEIYTLAGVWEKNPLFYTATSLQDLADDEWRNAHG